MNIYIGNLAYSVTEEELKNAFGQFGEIQSAKIITDKYSGQSKGFAFVEMDDSEGQAAIDGLNGTEINGREVKVNKARPPENRSRGGGGGNYNKKRNRW